MKVSREDVLTMFRVWQADGALLRCDFSSERFAACLRARVREITDSEIKLWSDDTFSELVLRVTSDLRFEYADPRDFPHEATVFVRGLEFSWPNKDTIRFLELVERSGA